jgi:hypothetical protein
MAIWENNSLFYSKIANEMIIFFFGKRSYCGGIRFFKLVIHFIQMKTVRVCKANVNIQSDQEILFIFQ